MLNRDESAIHRLSCGHDATGTPRKLPYHPAVGLWCPACRLWTALVEPPRTHDALLSNLTDDHTEEGNP